jgi:hypothetical protein
MHTLLLLRHGNHTGPDTAHLEAHDKALHLLHMRLEVGRLDGQLAVAAEAQHVLKLAVPRHAVAALLLIQQFLQEPGATQGQDCRAPEEDIAGGKQGAASI